MPYIKKERREYLEPGEYGIPSRPETAGELNYVVTQEILSYINRHKESYSVYNEVIGVLECAKLELYRRKVGLFEDEKITTNGDVYF